MDTVENTSVDRLEDEEAFIGNLLAPITLSALSEKGVKKPMRIQNQAMRAMADISESDEDDYAEEETYGEEGSSDEDMEDSDSGHAEAQKDDAMKELEEEYIKLKDEEQNILRNLKSHKDEDIRKGQAVKNQRAFWNKALEVRFLLQKPFSSSNRLPQEPTRSLFSSADSEVSEAYSDLIASSKETLDAILELQQALLASNPQITPSGVADDHLVTKKMEDSHSEDLDEEWSQISEMQSRFSSFRDKSIDKWQRKALVATGAAAIKSKLHAFNQSISEQVATYMEDPSKMVKGMQHNRSLVAVFGKVPRPNEDAKPESLNILKHNVQEAVANGDPELLDDSEFYQQLLKEFFETVDTSPSETALLAHKRLQTKKRKLVDRRASKSRKIRYHVHEKLVNFMAPRAMNLPSIAPNLFANVFGGKAQKTA